MKNRIIQPRGHAPLEIARARSGRPSLMGFTLVELLVSLGIFMVMTGVVLANYRGYNTNALFANASEDIVLALRQAQVYGVGVKGTGTSFTTPYGVYFEEANPNQIIIFADIYPPAVAPSVISGDGTYNSGNDTIVDTISWGGVVSFMTLTCDAGACGSNTASVTFKRPNPDAVIKDGTGIDKTRVEVLIGKGAKESTIIVTSTGQISLQ